MIEKRKIYKTRTAEIWRDSYGITHAIAKVMVELVLEDAIENLNVINKLNSNMPGIVLADMRYVKSATKEHRDYFATSEASKAISAGAMLVKSPLAKVMGNLFLRVSKPSYTVQLFTSEQRAVEWLKTFLIVNQTYGKE